ncbi:hypothetical protein Tsubulata_000361 [Turnera subulata]|uniref:Phospholipase-like protein n=1 Tax=Turnera subulata TaxID=218843 RepID=A0A9Q0IY63_9ROSI|nr:hypothetical protein Tsubulata_000361 [Turnera subulata]
MPRVKKHKTSRERVITRLQAKLNGGLQPSRATYSSSHEEVSLPARNRPDVVLRYARRYVNVSSASKPVTGCNVKKFKGLLAELIERATAATAGFENCGECDMDDPSVVPVKNHVAAGVHPVASRSTATKQVVLGLTTAASKVPAKMPVESACNTNPEIDMDDPSVVPVKNHVAAGGHPVASPSTTTKQVVLGVTTAASKVPAKMPVESARNTNPEIEHPTQSLSFGLTEMVDRWVDEVSSVVESGVSALMTVHGYTVKAEVAPLLQNIMEKYGDISTNSVLETAILRAPILEKICEFIQRFKASTLDQLKLADIENALNGVHDARKVGFEVSWLQKRLEDILMAKQLLKQSGMLKEAKDKNNQVIKEKKEMVKGYEALMLVHQKVINDSKKAIEDSQAQMLTLQEKASLTKKQLDEAYTKADEIKETVSNGKDKVAYFVSHPLLDDLL